MNHSELSIMDLRNLIDYHSEYRCRYTDVSQCSFSSFDCHAGR